MDCPKINQYQFKLTPPFSRVIDRFTVKSNIAVLDYNNEVSMTYIHVML